MPIKILMSPLIIQVTFFCGMWCDFRLDLMTIQGILIPYKRFFLLRQGMKFGNDSAKLHFGKKRFDEMTFRENDVAPFTNI